MTWRYAAYALALELHQYDVDAMLTDMTAMQFNEWLAFFRIREELRNAPPETRSQEDPGALRQKIVGAFTRWRERQKAGRAQGA